MPRNPAISRIRPGWLGLCLLFAAPAFAHDTLPKEWCLDPNTVPVVVAHFDFAPETLALYRERNPILKDPPPDLQCNDLRSCGIVDDWFWADQMAQQFCIDSQTESAPEPASLRAQEPQNAKPMPFVHAPLSFNARDHHGEYSFRSGHLRGTCVVCKPAATSSALTKPATAGDPPSR